MIDWKKARQVSWSSVVVAILAMVIMMTTEATAVALIWLAVFGLAVKAVLNDVRHIQAMEAIRSALEQMKIVSANR